MKQLLTRVDDEVHQQLKAKAHSEGRSVNDLVTEAVLSVIRGPGTSRTVRERARISGKLVEIEQPPDPPSLDALEACTTGTGTAVSDAFEADRGAW